MIAQLFSLIYNTFISALITLFTSGFQGFKGFGASALHKYTTLYCIVSYQNEETVGWEVLVSWDGWEHRQNQAAKHQNEPKT